MRELYLEMVDLNGTYQNKALRRMSDETLASLREYAAAQGGITDCTGRTSPNNIAWAVRMEQMRRNNGGRRIPA